MFDRLSEKIASRIFEDSDINTDSKEIIVFGLSQLITSVFNLYTIIVIGFLFGMPMQAIIFTITYIPLRIFAGGYHADTPFRCYVLSITMIVAILCGIKWLNISDLSYMIITVISCLIVFIISPVDNANKRLDDTEHIVYRRVARIIVILEAILMLLFYMLDIEKVYVGIVYALFAVCIMLILGEIKKCRERHNLCTKNDKKQYYF